MLHCWLWGGPALYKMLSRCKGFDIELTEHGYFLDHRFLSYVMLWCVLAIWFRLVLFRSISISLGVKSIHKHVAYLRFVSQR